MKKRLYMNESILKEMINPTMVYENVINIPNKEFQRVVIGSLAVPYT